MLFIWSANRLEVPWLHIEALLMQQNQLPTRQAEEGDDAILFYTGGTTGRWWQGVRLTIVIWLGMFKLRIVGANLSVTTGIFILPQCFYTGIWWRMLYAEWRRALL